MSCVCVERAQEFPEEWFKGLAPKQYQHKTYRADVNKWGVECGGSVLTHHITPRTLQTLNPETLHPAGPWTPTRGPPTTQTLAPKP